MSNDTITLFLADDAQIVVEGIMDLVSGDPRIKVVGHCNNGLDVLEKVRAARPAVLVQDISIPGINGLEVCRLVKTEVPATAVLMLSMNANDQCIIDALENGASGYIAKEAVATELCDAVHAISRGEIYLGQGISRSVLDRVKIGDSLRPQEADKQANT